MLAEFKFPTKNVRNKFIFDQMYKFLTNFKQALVAQQNSVQGFLVQNPLTVSVFWDILLARCGENS